MQLTARTAEEPANSLFPFGNEHLSDTVVCFCGGIGWLPHGTRR